MRTAFCDTSFADGAKPDEKNGKMGVLKHSLGYLSGLSMSLHLTYHEAGFVQMLLVDSNSFNRGTYQFSFVRNDFLGTIPTVVFDVSPIKKGNSGRFFGRRDFWPMSAIARKIEPITRRAVYFENTNSK